jgi:hypothetical protein
VQVIHLKNGKVLGLKSGCQGKGYFRNLLVLSGLFICAAFPNVKKQSKTKTVIASEKHVRKRYAFGPEKSLQCRKRS